MSHVKPFVKWVGGKRQLLPELQTRLPEDFANYYEPFLGGGALFFAIRDRVQNATLGDINEELINAYLAIRDNVSGLIEELKKHTNTEEHFLVIRDADRHAEYKWNWSPIQKAARFIFLNKTCFNGLYRVNSKGFFNVPYGHYNNPTIVDEDNLLQCHEILNNSKTTLIAANYKDTLKDVLQMNIDDAANTLVYLDPPYVPLNVSSSFTQYSKDGFDTKDQIALRDFCKQLNSLGVKFMQSNSSAPFVYELYKDFTIEEVEAKRSVGASPTSREKVKEVIIRNYKW